MYTFEIVLKVKKYVFTRPWLRYLPTLDLDTEVNLVINFHFRYISNNCHSAKHGFQSTFWQLIRAKWKNIKHINTDLDEIDLPYLYIALFHWRIVISFTINRITTICLWLFTCLMYQSRIFPYHRQQYIEISQFPWQTQTYLRFLIKTIMFQTGMFIS